LAKSKEREREGDEKKSKRRGKGGIVGSNERNEFSGYVFIQTYNPYKEVEGTKRKTRGLEGRRGGMALKASP